MKKYLFVFLAVLLSNLSFSQTETLFTDEATFGGFGGPMIEFSNINGSLVADVGGGGAFVVNEFFFGGYGLGNDASSVEFEGQKYDIDFGHGGLWFGYAFMQHKLIHIYSSFKVGWGSAKLKVNDDKLFDDNLLALTPDLGIELNITNWFKLGITGGYRYISGIEDLPVLNNDDFTGMTGALTFRFGGFGDYESYENRRNKIEKDF